MNGIKYKYLMAPRKIEKTTFWELFDDECVIGTNGRVDGPQYVRVQEYDEAFLVQSLEEKIEVLVEKGTPFEKVVQKKP